MSTRSHEVLHADHRHWEADVRMWRDDIEEWRKEQAQLFAELETALGAEVAGLKDHATSIGKHDERLLQHERLIAQLDHSSEPKASEIDARFADAHRKESKKHDTMRQAHERLKRHHHRAMARLAVVLQALGEKT